MREASLSLTAFFRGSKSAGPGTHYDHPSRSSMSVDGIPSVFYTDHDSDFTSRHIFNRNLYLVGETSTDCNRRIEYD